MFAFFDEDGCGLDLRSLGTAMSLLDIDDYEINREIEERRNGPFRIDNAEFNAMITRFILNNKLNWDSINNDLARSPTVSSRQLFSTMCASRIDKLRIAFRLLTQTNTALETGMVPVEHIVEILDIDEQIAGESVDGE